MKAVCRDLGLMDYAACWELQRTLFEELLAEKNRRRNGCAAKADGTTADATPDAETPPNKAGAEDADTTPEKAGARPENAGTTLNEVDAGPKGATDIASDEADTRSDEAGTILLVEHPPVYTLGKSGHAENLLVGQAALEQLGARFFHIDRGGDITYHGPGQLVCYPILDLERLGIGLREYIDRLEETVIRVVERYGIAAGRIGGASGVWLGRPTEKRNAETERNAKDTDGRSIAERKDAEADGRNAAEKKDAEEQAGEKSTEEERTGEKGPEEAARIKRDVPRKICAIGVRSSRYVTMHGFALNVGTDLEWFSRINPCGFSDRGVTSMARETGHEVAMEEVKRLVIRELERQLNLEIRT